MEERRKIYDLLDQIPQPLFLVKNDRIEKVNQAAAALLLAPGQAFSPMLSTGSQEYAEFREGQLCLMLTVNGHSHRAVVDRLDDTDLVFLDSPEALEEFRAMALVSMQLRMPLMQALTGAQQLTAGSDDPAGAKLNSSLMQILRLVNNMSDISRYTDAFRMETRDVDAFLLELFEKAQALTEGKAELTFEGLKQPVFSLIDPEQLERAVWNILSNCLKFMPQGGCIQAKLSRRGNMLCLTVQDDGCGIAEQVKGMLFHRYLRQPGIEDSRYGLGLGLSLIRTAAANHGGTVLISSGKEGGTKITVTLAIRQDSGNVMRSPLLRPDYAGGWDHGLVELADCISPDLYSKL